MPPSLSSTLGPLFLNNNVLKVLETYYKITLEGLQHLHSKSPSPIVYFLSRSPPAKALLHIICFNLLVMIA